ncbi:MAG: zinc ribbon domain-containing protein [Polyangiales bacterium]
MSTSVREQMEILKQLVVADEEIRKLDLELGKEKESLEVVKKDLIKVREKIEQERAQYDVLEKDRGARIQEARVLGQQVERSREKLNRTRNEKESNAVTREIEETRKLLRDVEDTVGRGVVQLEELKKAIVDHEEEEAGYVAKIGRTEGDVNAKVGEIESARGAAWQKREVVAKNLPSLTLRKYDQVRIKRHSGAAKLEQGRCKACNMSIPPQLAQRIMRADILEQCPSCNRYLYVDGTPSMVPPPPK